MADRLIIVDTSVLIDLFRKTDKQHAFLVSLVKQGYEYAISAVTEYEIYRGAVLGQQDYWDELLHKILVLPFDQQAAKIAVGINADLKRLRQQIAVPDLFIAATAVSNQLPLATLNKKHFQRVEQLEVIS